MKVFLTGGHGFVGTNLAKALKGHELYLYKRGEDVKKAVQSFNPDVIYHLAAELRKEKGMVNSNQLLTGQLLEASRDLNYKAFVYTGTSSEYGIKTEPMREDMVCSPTTHYAETKLVGTAVCLQYTLLTNKNIIVLRPFSLYGPGEHDYRFFPRAIKCCLDGKTLDLWEGNHDWTYIDDFIKALLLVAEMNLPGQIINFGTGIQTSNEEVVKLIEEIVGRKIKLRKHKGCYREGDSEMWVADTRKASGIGLFSETLLAEGLKRQIDDIRKKSK